MKNEQVMVVRTVDLQPLLAGRLIRIPIGLLATPVIPVRTRETECYKLIGLVAGIQSSSFD